MRENRTYGLTRGAGETALLRLKTGNPASTLQLALGKLSMNARLYWRGLSPMPVLEQSDNENDSFGASKGGDERVKRVKLTFFTHFVSTGDSPLLLL